MDTPGRAALALDLIEEFRPLADRLALSLVNRNQVDAGSFAEREGGAVMLEGIARKAVVIGASPDRLSLVVEDLAADLTSLVPSASSQSKPCVGVEVLLAHCDPNGSRT